MSFTWSRLQKGDVLRKDRLDEIVDNMWNIQEAVRRSIDWSRCRTEYFEKDSLYLYDVFIDLRSDIDELDAIKCNDCDSYNAYERVAVCPMAKTGYCSTDYEVHDVKVYAEDRSFEKGTYDGTVLVDEDASVYGTHNNEYDVGDYGTENVSYFGTNDGIVDNVAGQCTSDDRVVYGSNYSLDDGTHNSGYDTGFYTADNETYFVNQNAYHGSCSADDSGYNSSYDFGVDSGYNSSENIGYDNTVDGTDYVTVDTDDKTGYNSTYDSGVLTGEYKTVYSGYDSGYLSGENGLYYSNEHTGYDSGFNSNVDVGYYYGFDSSYDYGVDSGYNTTVDSGDDGVVCGSYNSGVKSSYDSAVCTTLM